MMELEKITSLAGEFIRCRLWGAAAGMVVTKDSLLTCSGVSRPTCTRGCEGTDADILRSMLTDEGWMRMIVSSPGGSHADHSSAAARP